MKRNEKKKDIEVDVVEVESVRVLAIQRRRFPLVTAVDGVATGCPMVPAAC